MKRNCRIAAFVLLTLCLILFVCSACGGEPDSVVSDVFTEHGSSDALYRILKSEKEISEATFFTRKDGMVSTSVGVFPLDLGLHSSRIHEGTALFTEDVVEGILSGASIRTYEQGNAHLILQGTSSGETTFWNETPIALTDESFRASMGQCFGGLSVYLLNEQTIRSASLLSEENGVLTYEVELDSFAATESYSKRLKTILGTNSTPRFTRIRLIVTTYEDALPISVSAVEEFTIDLPVFGETKCTASYEEHFFYEKQIEIPSVRLFASHVNDHAQGGNLQMPGALSRINALLGNDQTMDLSIATPEADVKGTLSINPSMKTLWLSADGVNLLYSDGKYYLKTIENKLLAEKEAFEKAVSPVVLRTAQASLTPWKDLLTGLRSSMQNSGLVYSAEVGNISLKLTFSTDLSSFVSLEFSDEKKAFDLRRSSAMLELPTLIGYEDVSDSLTALSFFDTGDDTMQYELTAEGMLSAEGLVKVSFRDGFAVEFRGDGVSASLTDGQVTANLNGVSFTGTAKEAESLLSVWTDPKNGSKRTGLLTNLSVGASDGVLTISTDGKTYTLSSDKLIVETASALCTVVKKGGSFDPVAKVDPVCETVTFEDLLAFSNASVYPSLLGSGSVKAAVRLEVNGELYNGELILLPQKPFMAGLTLSNGDDTIGVVFTEETIYYSDSRMNAFIDTLHLSEFRKLLSAFSKEGEKEWKILACDREELSLSYGDLTVRVTDEGVLAVSDDLTLSVFHFTSSPERVLISKPNKLLCTDLFALANLMNGIREQSEFTFVGTWETKQFTSSVDRLSLLLGTDGSVSSIGMEWSAAGKTPKKLYMTDECIFLDEGGGKYFCTREALQPILGETPADFASVLKQVSHIALQNQALILSADTFDATLKFEDGKLTSVLYSTPEETYRLEKAYLPPLSLPKKDEYRDITALGTLFDAIRAAKDSGSFTVSGSLTLSVSILDGKAPFSGVFDVQDGLTGYLSFEVPYVQGVTGRDIPSSDGLRILSSCKIKSEAFILADRVYIRKEMTATYGVVFSKTVTLTKTGYFTLDEFRSNPMKAFVYLLNIENGLVNAVPAAQPWNTLYGIDWTGDRYSFDLAPEMLSTAAKSLNLKAEVERDHLSMMTLTSDIAPAKLRIDMKFAGFGQADPSRYLPKDFSTFPHL